MNQGEPGQQIDPDTSCPCRSHRTGQQQPAAGIKGPVHKQGRCTRSSSVCLIMCVCPNSMLLCCWFGAPNRHSFTGCQVGLQTQYDQSAAVQQSDLTVSMLSAERSLAPLISAATAPGLNAQESGSLHAAVKNAICSDSRLLQLQPAF